MKREGIHISPCRKADPVRTVESARRGKNNAIRGIREKNQTTEKEQQAIEDDHWWVKHKEDGQERKTSRVEKGHV